MSKAVIIPVAENLIGGAAVPTFNGRDLHTDLVVKKDFSDWIKVQIKRAMLVENVDFVVLPQKGENLSGGRPAMEYHLTIEAGKHIAMLSGTARGKVVRNYFLDCEKKAKAAAPVVNTRMLFDGCRGTHQRQRQCINANELIKQ